MDDLINDNQMQQVSVKERLEQIGAGVLAGMAMLVSVELMLEHSAGSHHDTGKGDHTATVAPHGSLTEQFARAEGKGETARLPEEFDIGLQTPDISGL